MTTFDPTHGAGGLGEVHRWTSASGRTFDMNVEDADTGVRLREIPGLHALPEREDPRAKKSGRHGETSRDRTYGGKTVVYRGVLEAPSLPELYVARTQLLAAYADLRPGVMQIIRHTDHPGPTHQYTARVLEADVPDVQANAQYEREVTVGLRLDDPRIYFPSLAVDETDSDEVTVTNEGSAPADPLIIITVPTGLPDIVITDGTRTITVPDVYDQPLYVDFKARTVMQLDVGSDPPFLYPIPFLLSGSGWWDPYVDGIAPGATVTITQTGGDDITVQFTPSTW